MHMQLMRYERVGVLMNTKSCLHPIHLDIRVNDITIHDRFEWDIFSEWNSPETFAAMVFQCLF